MQFLLLNLQCCKQGKLFPQETTAIKAHSTVVCDTSQKNQKMNWKWSENILSSFLSKAQGVSMSFLFFISLHIKVCGSLEIRARVFARPWLNGSSLMSVWNAACFSCGMNLFPSPKPRINGGLFFPRGRLLGRA